MLIIILAAAVAGFAAIGILSARKIKRLVAERHRERERLQWNVIGWLESRGYEFEHALAPPRLEIEGHLRLESDEWTSHCPYDGHRHFKVHEVVTPHDTQSGIRASQWESLGTICGECGHLMRDPFRNFGNGRFGRSWPNQGNIQDLFAQLDSIARNERLLEEAHDGH